MIQPHASRLLEALLEAGVRTFPLADGVMERVADTTNPQPLCAIARFCDVDLDAAAEADSVLVCLDVRDPGNLGSTLRSADAAGIGAVVCAGGTVDLYNPKTVRASAGSLFRVPVALCDDEHEAIARLRAAGLHLVGTSGTAARDYAAVTFPDRVAVVMGNEANGLSPDQEAAMDELVSIPMRDGAESLNVAMAATVLCFELARRRRAPSA
jgi:RNA methyltransferase, TrmH family